MLFQVLNSSVIAITLYKFVGYRRRSDSKIAGQCFRPQSTSLIVSHARCFFDFVPQNAVKLELHTLITICKQFRFNRNNPICGKIQFFYRIQTKNSNKIKITTTTINNESLAYLRVTFTYLLHLPMLKDLHKSIMRF